MTIILVTGRCFWKGFVSSGTDYYLVGQGQVDLKELFKQENHDHHPGMEQKRKSEPIIPKNKDSSSVKQPRELTFIYIRYNIFSLNKNSSSHRKKVKILNTCTREIVLAEPETDIQGKD